MVQGIGLVLSGINKGNPIKIKQKLFLGPFNSQFKEIQVKSIHNSLEQNINETIQGVQLCLAIKTLDQKDIIDRTMIRKGMVIIDDINKYKKNIVKSFYARINVLHHATTIKTGYSPVIHCGPIRQSAHIDLDFITDENDKKILRSGDNKIVKFTFDYHSEFMEENMIFFFRDGTTKGVGEVLNITDVN
jgi:elongation factor 1-alpha